MEDIEKLTNDEIFIRIEGLVVSFIQPDDVRELLFKYLSELKGRKNEIKEVEVIKEIIKEVVKEVPVIKEVIKEVPIETPKEETINE